MRKILTIFIALFFMTNFAHAQLDRCHALAASPTDPARKAQGVPYNKIDGINASNACEIAVQKFPTDGQLWFQYGRALEKAKRINEAIIAYQRGSELENPGAMNNLGELYRDGKGFERDIFIAEILFQNASNKNFPEAAQNLDSLTKLKQSSTQRIIPLKFHGKFSNENMSCKKTNENSKDFGNEFMGITVREKTISKFMEYNCEILNLKFINENKLDIILKCSANSDMVYLNRLLLTENSILNFNNPEVRQTRCSN